jgi:UDP-N-acetylmuramoyl-tripeptide--D-alanyl-D-alanine ligase
VIPALASEGIVVLPAQDAYVQIWRDCAASHQKKVIDFALHINGDTTPALVTGEIHSLDDSPIIQTVKINTPLGTAQIKLNIAGEHHVRNALAATAAAIAANIPLSSIVLGLQAFEPVKGRMQPHHITVLNYARDIQLIDDTYNANPDSVIAAIDMLSQIKKLQTRSVLVLGDMGEVGDQGILFHTEVGLYAAAKGISVLYTVGDLMKYAHNAFKNSTGNGDKHTQHFANTAELQAALLAKQTLHSNDTVLIKGSRFMRMEFIVEALLNQKMTESKQ